MEGQTIRKWHWFWAWQDGAEEAWLEAMAREGLHLKSASIVEYTFQRGEPKHVVYRLDYNNQKVRGVMQQPGSQ